jgi:hypothetical protein
MYFKTYVQKQVGSSNSCSDELIHLLLSVLNYFMTGSHPPVYKTLLYVKVQRGEGAVDQNLSAETIDDRDVAEP